MIVIRTFRKIQNLTPCFSDGESKSDKRRPGEWKAQFLRMFLKDEGENAAVAWPWASCPGSRGKLCPAEPERGQGSQPCPSYQKGPLQFLQGKGLQPPAAWGGYREKVWCSTWGGLCLQHGQKASFWSGLVPPVSGKPSKEHGGAWGWARARGQRVLLGLGHFQSPDAGTQTLKRVLSTELAQALITVL